MTQVLYNMLDKNAIWTATFVKAELLGKTSFRRLHFKNVKNEEEEIIKESFFIDESENLRAINSSISMTGEIISFVIDENLKVINFCYPHDSREETHSKIQQKGKGVLEKLKEKRKKNERSE